MKKLGVLLLAGLLLFQMAVFADDTTKDAPEIITYENAVKLLLENNQSLKTIEKQIEIQKEAILEVNAESRRLEQHIREDDDKVLDRANAVYLDPIDAENKLSDLERSLEDKKFELKQSVLDYYVNWATIQNKINFYTDVLNVQQKSYEQKQLELKLGKITENELLNYQIAYETAQKDMESAQREYDLALLDFNYLVMDSLEIKYSMDISDLEGLLIGNYIDLESIDLKVLAENNIKEDSKLASLKEALPKIEKQKWVSQLYSSSITVIEDYDKSMEDNKHDTENQINTVKYAVYSDYYNLKGLGIDIKIAQNNLKLAKSTLEVLKVKESVGLVTSLEVVTAEKDVLSAENAVTNALNAYYKAYHKFVRYY